MTQAMTTFLDNTPLRILDKNVYIRPREPLIAKTYRKGNLGHSRTRGTVVFLDLFKKLKTLNFKVSTVI